jgi:hypothetical protein
VSARHSAGCFARGLALSLSKPYLAASLWLTQLLLAAVLILPISNALHDSLDRSSAGSRMVANPDYCWWETLQRKHADLLGDFPKVASDLLQPEGAKLSQLAGLRGIGATAVSLAMLAIVLHAFALGGVLGTLREPQASLVTFGREGMRRFPAFVTFTLAALAAAAAVYRWVFLETGEALRHRLPELDTERTAFMVTGLRVLGLLLSLAAVKLLADAVRTVWVARPDLPPVSRFFTGMGGFFARPLRLLGVLLYYVGTTGALYLVWLWVDPAAGGEARFALAPLIVTQQVFVFVRLLVKVGYYAGISEALTRAPSPEYSYVAPAPENSAALGAGDEEALDRSAGGI